MTLGIPFPPKGLLVAVALAATACVPTVPPGPPVADTPAPPAASRERLFLVSGGFVVEEPGKEPVRKTIAILGGRIVAVEDDAAFADERDAGVTEVRVAGATVVPGLTDAHAHLYQLGASLEKLTFVGADLDECLRRVDQAVRERRPLGREKADEWIEGRGWDQNLWPGARFPTREDLDRVAPVNPVVLTRIDGHAAWCNSAALRAAGITEDLGDPPGGRILRDSEGRPNGILIDRAMEMLDAAVPLPSDETIRRRLERAVRAAAKAGLTEVHDAGVDPVALAPRALAILGQLADEGQLPIRVYAMLPGDADPAWLETQYRIGPRRAGTDDRLRVRAVKFYLDGALGSRGAALLEPYADDAGNSGLLLTDPEALRTRAEAAVKAGFQVAIHAIGDRANRIALDTFESLRPLAGTDPRFRIEHAQVIDPADIPRFAKLGVVASMQPTHATSDMPWAAERLGPGRLAGAYAWKSLLASGARVAGGSDFPIEKVEPVLGLHAAVTRTDLDGNPPGGWLAEQKLTRAEALALYTTGAAYAAFEDGERGKIAPGYRADLTVLLGSPTAVPEPQLAVLPVMLTIVGGQIVSER